MKECLGSRVIAGLGDEETLREVALIEEAIDFGNYQVVVVHGLSRLRARHDLFLRYRR